MKKPYVHLKDLIKNENANRINSENPGLFNSTVAKFFSEPYKGNESRN